MSVSVVTYDNRVLSGLDLTDRQWNDLSQLCGRSVSSLCSGDDSDLLVFPHNFEINGDQIGDSVIADIENRNSLRTYNMMGFVGSGDIQLKIKSRFDEGKDDYFMHYMLERVFAINLFNLKHSTANESLFDFVLFLFP